MLRSSERGGQLLEGFWKGKIQAGGGRFSGDRIYAGDVYGITAASSLWNVVLDRRVWRRGTLVGGVGA
ncbi:hypothetical protein D3C81_1895880 [compost metagenome]